MKTALSNDLQIAPGSTAAPLTPEQKRFNRLIGQIGTARDTLAAWQREIPRYHQAHVKRLEPLIAALRRARRETVLALDLMLDQTGWSRTDIDTLRDAVCERAAELIGGDDAAVDAEMRAVFDKHSEADYDTVQRESGLAFKDAVEAMTGADLGSDDDLGSAEDVFERLQAQHDKAAEHAAAAAAERRDAKKKTAAERRRADQAQEATQSVRQVYRQLASALHPDREPDDARRAAKTEAMQRVNQAYAANDLLALLELQLEIEQVDARHLEGASAQRLKHYNKVLAEQLEELKHEIEAVQLRFELDFGLDLGRTLHPAKLGVVIDQGWRELSALNDFQQHELSVLSRRASAKAWLKEARRRARRGDDGDFF